MPGSPFRWASLHMNERIESEENSERGSNFRIKETFSEHSHLPNNLCISYCGASPAPRVRLRSQTLGGVCDSSSPGAWPACSKT